MTHFDIQIPKLSIGKRTLLSDIHWQCTSEQLWCIMGANGSGKTTLLHTLAGLNKNHHAQIKINQQPLSELSNKERAKHIGLLLQDQDSSHHHTVLEAVTAARYPHQALFKKDHDTQSLLILEQLNLLTLKDRPIYTLSGGEQQRLHFAMLLAQAPSIYLLDEPSNHLDFKYQQHILTLLRNIAYHQKKLVITILHDINLAARFADYFCFIYPNQEIEFGKKHDMLTEEKLSKLFQCDIKKIQHPSAEYFYTPLTV